MRHTLLTPLQPQPLSAVHAHDGPHEHVGADSCTQTHVQKHAISTGDQARLPNHPTSPAHGQHAAPTHVSAPLSSHTPHQSDGEYTSAIDSAVFVPKPMPNHFGLGLFVYSLLKCRAIAAARSRRCCSRCVPQWLVDPSGFPRICMIVVPWRRCRGKLAHGSGRWCLIHPLVSGLFFNGCQPYLPRPHA